jgi:hypothetical protein
MRYYPANFRQCAVAVAVMCVDSGEIVKSSGNSRRATSSDIFKVAFLPEFYIDLE